MIYKNHVTLLNHLTRVYGIVEPCAVCQGRLDPFCTLSTYIKWVKTSWTYIRILFVLSEENGVLLADRENAGSPRPWASRTRQGLQARFIVVQFIFTISQY